MLRHIRIDQLQVGMFLHELDGNWLDHPFWKTRFLLTRSQDLDKLRESGIQTLRIDTSKGLDVQQAGEPLERVSAVEGTPAEPALRPERLELHAELPQAVRLLAASKAAVTAMFNDARLGNAVDAARVNEVVTHISASVLRNPSAMISLARLKRADDYTYMHSVAVCALMIALGRSLKLPEDQVTQAGTAGLLHDIGKLAIPDEILNKPGRLTDEEFRTIKQHPLEGCRILQQTCDVGGVALDVCMHHHEKVDGSGYPYGLAGEQISLFARMGAVCDVYDAITSQRCYKSSWDPAVSISRMAEWRGHFDNDVLHAFVRCVGIYPVGALVRLQSGRLGVVVEQHEQSLLTPKVNVFFSTRSNLPLPQQVIDLSQPGCNDRIIGRENSENWGFRQLDDLWAGPYLPA